MTSRFAVLLLAALGAGCRRTQATSDPPPASGTRVEYGAGVALVRPPAPGEIGVADLARVTPQIRSLQVEPAQLELRVGQRFAFRDLRVTAIDSAGQVLGRLPDFNRRFESGAAFMDLDGVVAVRAGESRLLVRASLYAEYGGQGPVPEVWVTIVVR